MNIKTLLDQLEELWRKRGTFKSLVAFLIVLNATFVTVVSATGILLTQIQVLLPAEPDGYIRFYTYSFFVVGLSNLFLLALWSYWRSAPRLANSKIGILFAPSLDQECEALVNSLYEEFKRELSRRGISKKISHRLLPQHMAVNNAEDAHRLIERTGARLVIYGNVRKGKIEGEGLEGFESISFTVRHRNLAEAEVKPVLTDLANALAYRAFVSRDRNSFLDRRTLVENIGEVASFFIAMALTLDGELDRAESILDSLLLTLERKLEVSRSVLQLNLFKNSVSSCLTVALEAKCSQIYYEYVVDSVTQRRVDTYARACMDLLEKILRLNQKTSKYYLLEAVLHFHFGEVGRAKICVKKAIDLAPKNSAAPYFSAAFLDLWQERYDRALMYYKKAEECTDYTLDVILSVILFLQSIAGSHPERIQIKFALAYINDRFYDAYKAIEDYESFLSAAGELGKYSRLRVRAKERLELLRQ